MNRIISEELTKEFALLLSHQLIQCQAPDRPFYQKMFDELRNAPLATALDQPPIGQVGEGELRKAIQAHLETVWIEAGSASKAIASSTTMVVMHALRTQPQAPVVEVLSELLPCPNGSIIVSGVSYTPWLKSAWRGTPQQAMIDYEPWAEVVPSCAYDAAISDRNALISRLHALLQSKGGR